MRGLLVMILLPALGATGIGCADEPAARAPGATENYVPDAPIAYDARYLDGSFEGNQGTGWDSCHTRTPGTIAHPQTGAAEGTSYVSFESGGCEGICSPTNPSASHLYNWFSTAPSATAKMGIYFDGKNLGSADPSGVLRFYATDLACEQSGVLAEIDLSRLQLTSEWSTRCVTVTGPGADAAIGMSISDGTYKVGLDAIRLGAPCHAGS
jgi:hypothetical protein